MVKKKLSLHEHEMNADDLAIAFHHLSKVVERCYESYPKSSKLMKTLFKIDPAYLNGQFTEVRHLLDEEFHSIISNDEFEELGNIYYSLEKRYEQKQKHLV
jgi:hypothetical protein